MANINFLGFDLDSLLDESAPYLFISMSGAPMSFHVDIHNEQADSTVLTKIFNLIQNCGGVHFNDYSQMMEFSLLLAGPTSYKRTFDRPCFQVAYIFDCARAGTLLNLNDYPHDRCPLFNRFTDYMEIIWKRSRGFSKVQILPNLNVITVTGSRIESSKKRDKVVVKVKSRKTRRPYTRDEEENILRFILTRGRLDLLQGDAIWKKMEHKNVVPNRTYQSLKSHFIKIMLPNLETYDFIEEHEIEALRKK